MALSDPKYVIKNIVETYINGTPITKDNDLDSASDLHLYERGPEDIKNLFFTDDYDIVFFYGEPTVRSDRQIQDVPVHYVNMYPVTIVTVDKYNPALGILDCTAATMQAKGRTAIRTAIEASAQSATPAFTLTIMREEGRNSWTGGINIWRTAYYLGYTTG